MSRQVAISLLEDEVLRLCGKAHVPAPERQMTRHGHQSGWVAIAGQKLTVPRPRVRYTTERGEVALPIMPCCSRPAACPRQCAIG